MHVDPAWLVAPTQIEIWLVLAYAGAILIGARVVEAVARRHFARAQRHDNAGFEYIAVTDHYRCPGGRQLTRHTIEPDRKRAIYRAHPTSCATCALKSACTPHDDGRRLVRSLVDWAETDLARFHQRISMVMCGASVAVCGAGFWRWSGDAGAGYLLLALAASVLALGARTRHVITE